MTCTCISLTSRKRILKNLSAYYVSFCLVQTSFTSISNVLNVLNQDEGLGTASLLVSNVTSLILCLGPPQILIRLIGFKFTLIISQLCSTAFIFASLFPSWYTLMPASFIQGIYLSIFWTICGIYTEYCAKEYSLETGKNYHFILTIFSGIFSAIISMANVLSSILIAITLKVDNVKNKVSSNFDHNAYCGANNCPSFILPKSSSTPSISSVYLLCFILFGFIITAILITLFLVDNISHKQADTQKKSQKNAVSILREQFSNIFNVLKNPHVFLLMPITMASSIEISFIWTEYNRGYVTCVTDVRYIGYMNLVYGLTSLIFANILGYLTKFSSQPVMITFMIMTSLSNFLIMLIWTPISSSQMSILYLIAFLFGLSASYSNGQIRGLYGYYFPNDSSVYSAASFSSTFGYVIGFILSLFFCARVKIFIHMSLLIFSLTCYVILSYHKQNVSKTLINSVPSLVTLQKP